MNGRLPRLAGIGFLFLGVLQAEEVQGRVLAAGQPLAGVRVHPDRPPRIAPERPVPGTETDAEGRFRLVVEPSDAALVIEKRGFRRDLVPRGNWGSPLSLAPAPRFSEERVLVVRLDFAGALSRRTDAQIRSLYFGRDPGAATVANYFYEASKGELLLAEGDLLHLTVPADGPPPVESSKAALARFVLSALRGRPLGDLDRVDNATGAPRPDGRPDHLWIVLPGPPGSVTPDPAHLHPASLLVRPPGRSPRPWPLLLLTEETPLGNVVHEALHAMGEHRAGDLYGARSGPPKAGIWDLMDGGQYRGWDARHPETGPWVEDTGYSPSHPGPWVRTELWYRGRFAGTVPQLRVLGRRWEGWLDPIVRAPGGPPQRLTVADPRRAGAFWEFWVARPWGFEAGRIGGRFGPGHEGLVVAHVDPRRPGGPVQVRDAHPGSARPGEPRLPGRGWELEDAAFNLGPGEQSAGRDGPLSWVVQGVDPSGRMNVQIMLQSPGRPR
ncbi:MAG: carboxypeptidase regulatory-like domain-containing protein [Acidobacteria bacterium]|nr:carboxypeptidase regulatory-like domain-containing protein [Acidobacteriota bacterium]